MIRSKLPGRLAILGVAIGLGLMATWLYVDAYNPFHLPTEAQAPANYIAPESYWLLEDMTLSLCPGELLGFAAMDSTSRTAPTIIWFIAISINGGLYYLLGLAIAAIVKRLKS